MVRLIILIILISFCSFQKIGSANNRLSLKAHLGSWSKEGNFNLLTVKITLKNNTSDTLRYLGMTCSWDMLYTLSTEKFIFEGFNCNSNIPVLIKIPPHRKEEKELKLVAKNNPIEYHNFKFKIGFLFIDENSQIVMGQLLTGDSVFVINKEKIIWSDDLKIN
jgi:hypothetical protein